MKKQGFKFKVDEIVKVAEDGEDGQDYVVLDRFGPNPTAKRYHNLYQLGAVLDMRITLTAPESDLAATGRELSPYVTIGEIAQEMNLSRDTISNYTSRAREPRLEVAKRKINGNGIPTALIRRQDYVLWRQAYEAKKPFGSKLHKKRTQGIQQETEGE